mgnify:CR=1 FL=1
MISIVIAEEHPDVRTAWSVYLQGRKNVQVTGVCANGMEVIEMIPDLLPDIILMDVNMKPVSGIEITRKLTSKYPDLKIIGLSFHISSEYVKRMMEAGAKGYVLKFRVEEDLLAAIEEVSNGGTFISEGINRKRL